ncbi:MAG: cysteine hydrolase [Myxococcales bacterium]|nr:cysteine hydrolase [Myxococcales bacterium]MCB9749596.1 cysteine hydrolase [Myxococcales bacterium]
MNLDLHTTAVVITDPQVDVLSPDGALADLLHAQVAKRRVVDNLRALRDHAERAGVPVLYSTLERRAKHTRAPATNAPIYQLIHERGAMLEGAGAAIVPELAPTERTTLASPRGGMMAFGTTDLDALLRARGARTLIMGGMVLNLCLEANLRAAVDLGYEIILVSDATATISDAAHEAALASLALIAAKIVTTAELLPALTRAAAA